MTDDITRRLLSQIELYCGLPLGSLDSNDRYSPLRDIRHLVAHALRQEGLPLATIGRMLGARNHTTALNSIGRAEDMIATHDPIAQRYDTIRELVQIYSNYDHNPNRTDITQPIIDGRIVNVGY